MYVDIRICKFCGETKEGNEFIGNSLRCKKCKYRKSVFQIEEKECKQCLNIKKLDEFPLSKRAKDKKSSYCKDCLALNQKLRLRTNVNARIASNLRTRIGTVLKNNIKSEKTKILLGCSINKLKQHLESKFKKGMTQDNYGRNGWEIDHIRPCASFDLSKPEEQRKCFNYNNLQPLWATENRQKSNKIIKNP